MNDIKQKLIKGGIVGLLLPVVSSPLVCYILYQYQKPVKIDERGFTVGVFSFWDFYFQLLNNPWKLPTFMSLCVISNLAIFFYLLNKKKEVLARGIIFATMIYAAIFFIMKTT